MTDETVPNLEHLFKQGLGFDSHPAEWFDLFFPAKRTKGTHPKAVTMDDMTAWLNVKAKMANAGKGGGKYKGFVDFDKHEFMSRIYYILSHPLLKLTLNLKAR